MENTSSVLARLRQSAKSPREVQLALAQVSLRTLKDYFYAISAFAKVSAWREALDLLESMEGKGLRADMYCYSAALTALDKARQSTRAYKLFNEMKRSGVAPNVFTFTSTISACAKGSAQEAAAGLELLREMKAVGVVPTEITYNAAISACGDNWRAALDLMHEMATRGLTPTRISFSAAITACAKGKEGDEALQLFNRMQSRGIQPDIQTYNALVHALQFSTNWEYALTIPGKSSPAQIVEILPCYLQLSQRNP